MWDLCSLARDQTSAPCIGMESFNQQTTREVPNYCILYITHMQKSFYDRIRWKYFQIPQQEWICLTTRPVLTTIATFFMLVCPTLLLFA